MEPECICSVRRMTEIRFRNISGVNRTQTTNDFSPHAVQIALPWSLVGGPIFSFCQLPRIHKLATVHKQNHPFDHKSNVFSLKIKILKGCLCIKCISAAHHDHVRMSQKQYFASHDFCCLFDRLKMLNVPKKKHKNSSLQWKWITSSHFVLPHCCWFEQKHNETTDFKERAVRGKAVTLRFLNWESHGPQSEVSVPSGFLAIWQCLFLFY